MENPEDLFIPGPARGAKARILVAHLDGALDAGSAGGLAVNQLLRNLNVQRVATFDSDALIDYRSHRPIMSVEDWVTTDVSEPEIVVDLLHDDQGQPILLLHGPEPDAKWKSFTEAIVQLADSAGVEAVFSLHGLPAAVPHTRPATVHIQSTDAELVPDQPQMGGIAQFPAPFTSYLQHQMKREGRTGITLLATVPYYMSGSSFPRASSALLRRLADIADLSLPIGDLERGADEEDTQVDELIEHNLDLQNTVTALEHHFDEISGVLSADDEIGEPDDLLGEIGLLGDWERVMDSEPAEGAFPDAEQITADSDLSLADTIGDAIEKYLRGHSKAKRRRDVSVKPAQKPDQPKARHRAAEPWEQNDPDIDGSDIDGGEDQAED